MTKSVLIVKCSPPIDLEMEELSAGLIAKKKGKNHNVQVVSYEQLKSLCKNTAGKSSYEEISFIGHGSFHHIGSVPLKAKTIAERMIGSYPLAEVGQTAVLAFQRLKTHTFKFFTCESAVSRSTYGRDDSGECVVSESFQDDDADAIEELLERGKDAEVSNTEYVSRLILRKMQQTYDDRQVRVVGMNGVGYMMSNDLHMRCFDIEHLKDFCEIRKMIENVPDKAKNKVQIAALKAQEEALKKKLLEDRSSAHKIEQLVSLNTDSKKDEEETVVLEV